MFTYRQHMLLTETNRLKPTFLCQRPKASVIRKPRNRYFHILRICTSMILTRAEKAHGNSMSRSCGIASFACPKQRKLSSSLSLGDKQMLHCAISKLEHTNAARSVDMSCPARGSIRMTLTDNNAATHLSGLPVSSPIRAPLRRMCDVFTTR